MKETTARSLDLNREIRKSDYDGINEAQIGPLSWVDRIHDGSEVNNVTDLAHKQCFLHVKEKGIEGRNIVLANLLILPVDLKLKHPEEHSCRRPSP